jgi:hypothetical protein
MGTEDEAEELDLITRLLKERRDAQVVARAFVEAARDGDVSRFVGYSSRLDDEADAWQMAMRGVARIPTVSAAIQSAFIGIWVERKHLPLTVGHRPTMAKAARKLFPGGYTGSSLRLYRGTTLRERRSHAYGFSWTTQQDTARRFANGHSEAAKLLAAPTSHTGAASRLFQGIVLETAAPADAILLMREDEGYYDEQEVVVDPFCLDEVKVVAS